MDLARGIVNVGYAYERGIYGMGVGVAVVDTGICSHPDFIQGGNRIACFKDFIHLKTKMYDDSGHGTHVAGIIGGNGYASGGRYMGIAPKCNIIAIKSLNYKGDGNISEVIVALNWILEHKNEYNIRVVNLSFGTGTREPNKEGLKLLNAVEKIWDSGIVVVVAAGNGGPNPNTIAIPGSSKKVITVGASDDNIEVNLMGSKAKNYSGRGPTFECIKKPDIVAPASNIMSCNLVDNAVYDKMILRNVEARDSIHNYYIEKSGTSMSTPIVSGAIALLLSKYPSLTPKEVKIRIKNCGIDLGYPQSKQGWGLIDIKRMLG